MKKLRHCHPIYMNYTSRRSIGYARVTYVELLPLQQKSIKHASPLAVDVMCSEWRSSSKTKHASAVSVTVSRRRSRHVDRLCRVSSRCRLQQGNRRHQTTPPVRNLHPLYDDRVKQRGARGEYVGHFDYSLQHCAHVDIISATRRMTRCAKT